MAVNPFALFDDGGDDEDMSFAVAPRRDNGQAALYDNAANSIRTAYGKPLTEAAEGAYANQSGALDQIAAKFGIRRDKADERDKWLGVAAALLSPTQTGKTSESIANALGTYASLSRKQRDEEQSTSLALAKLMQQYQIADRRAKIAQYQAEHPRLALDVLGQARDPRTGLIVADALGNPGAGARPVAAAPEAPVEEEVEIPVLTVEQAALVPAGTTFKDINGKIRTKH